MSKQGKAGFFLVGGILGAAAGLLFAPKKGIELRENLFEKTMDILTDTQSVKEDILKWVEDFRSDDLGNCNDDIIISKDYSKDEEPLEDFEEKNIILDINKE